MPRPREFDIDTALDSAMQVFWAKGYESTSLDDLCEATGVGRSSLYSAFSDKRDLYLRALDHYENGSVERIVAALAKPIPVRKALAGFLERMIDDIVAGPGRRGCFIGNCAAELGRRDRTTAARVRRSIERIESVFREALTGAKSRGELPAKSDTAALARFLTAGIQGMRLVGKANPDRATLRDIAAVMLRCLRV